MMRTTVPRVLLALAGLPGGPAAAQLADYGAAQLARQAVDVRAPYLAQMARVRYGAAASKPATARSRVTTTFKRASGWFKPWSMANELSKKVEWDPSAPFGSGLAREEAQRQALTKLFTACLDTYEETARAQGLATDDLAVTYARAVALNAELGTGRRLAASEEAALRRRMRDEFARSPLYWTDADKQSIHETIVIITMLAVAGHANATRDDDPRAQAMFRETGRRNVTALTSATLTELRNARSALSRD